MFNKNIDQLYENYLMVQGNKRKELAQVQTLSKIDDSLFASYVIRNDDVSIEVVVDKVMRY